MTLSELLLHSVTERAKEERLSFPLALPKDWESFLLNNDNKQELTRLLSSEISNMDIGHKEIIVTEGQDVCYTLRSTDQLKHMLLPYTHIDADCKVSY